jgi:hypothetical protein
MAEREQLETRVGRMVTKIERANGCEIEIYFDDGNSLRLTADAGGVPDWTVLEVDLLGPE